MLLEMIEIDAYSLSYQGAVPNKFPGSLAFFQRCCLIYCNAYCDACTVHFPPDHGKHLQRSISLDSPLLVGGRNPAQQLPFLSVTGVHRVHVSWWLFVKKAFKHVGYSCSPRWDPSETHWRSSKNKK